MDRTVRLTRHDKATTYTLGRLTVLGYRGIALYECVTLELPWRNNQPRTSCIPEGIYPMVLEYSPAFNRKLWELKDVPGRSEVKIHPANYVTQLRGCIAPGLKYADLNGDGTIDVASSLVALVRFMSAMGDATHSEIHILAA